MHIHNQTFADWELILVDNYGSNYYEAVKPYPKVKYFIYTEKRGASHARNFGISQIKGELTCFFDDDDIMHPKYLETFNNIFQNPNILMARCGMEVITRSGKEINYSMATPEVVTRSRFITPTWLPCNSHDQIYYDRIAVANGWGYGKQIVVVDSVLVTARSSPSGGLREPGAGF